MIPTELGRQIGDMINLWHAWATHVKVVQRWVQAGKRITIDQMERAAELRWQPERLAVTVEKEMGLLAEISAPNRSASHGTKVQAR
jgi:hypothetical protein